MENVRELLEAERETEREFVAGAATEAPHPTGWPAALLMFHLASWRERLGDALRQVSRGQTYAPPPDNIDEVNDRELAAGASTSLEDAANRSDTALAGLITVWDAMGDRPFEWYLARTTGEALVRNSYHHPRVHLAEHFIERGDPARGHRLFEESATELRKASAPAHTLGVAVYNLACARTAQGRHEEAMRLLEEAFEMRPDLTSVAAADPNLTALRDLPRVRTITGV
jgi:tetratricopeptide (TPR) repeat protein